MHAPEKAVRSETPGVIAPPPLIFLSFLLAGIAADRLLVGSSIPLPDMLRHACGAALVVAGTFFLAGALGGFRAARTRPEPWKPTTAIVTAGVYRFSRNPIYVGMALAYAGLALTADSPVAMALLLAALALVGRGVIRREERYLEARFGADYLRYRARVRRWL